mmetsp:Transcript_17207/g.26639  ORF Transcript_17207/g.26639 Transcript_17207/m.26639 type:complete len:373 (+) Transcript_17207:174-1292(+)|eukprot:CAMPEP_0195310096 /NCGR_PEP_ID=MMETSP0707-20130614/39074_1 /TAXON_ID=33640 /ORGANISM="Asterionellopsis glacialis, Strain CCMP134" /LENGTH=372 /DNA_ID=CAMNT_0040374405 /DNA_START=155 /DNA_END=1273 /DNA_ORIENTATION=+
MLTFCIASSLIITLTSAFGPINFSSAPTFQITRQRNHQFSSSIHSPALNVRHWDCGYNRHPSQNGRQRFGSRLQAADVALALEAIDTFWQTSPYTAAAIVCGVKASAADLVVQNNQIKKDNDDQEEDSVGGSSIAATLDVKMTEGVEMQQQQQQQQQKKRVIVYDPDLNEEQEDQKLPLLVISDLDEKQKEETVMLYNPDLDDDGEQVAVGEEQKPNLQRTFAFLMYGSVYQGACQEFIYNHLYPVWFGDGTEVSVVLIKVIFDCLIQTTLVTLPVAYLTKALIYRYSAKEAFRRYRSDIQEHGLLIKYYSLWFPVNCLTFSVVPEHYRVTWIAFVSFFWLMILSSISSKQDLIDDENACSLIDGQTCNIDG